jgi:hypothetical protein
VSLGVTRTWCYVTRCHSVSLGFTWCHSVSLGVTRFHFGLTRCHLVSLGVTFVSLGFTWCHSVSPKPGTRDSRVRSRMTWVHSGVLRRSDGVFFLPSEKKKTARHYLDTFFCQKTGFPGSCWSHVRVTRSNISKSQYVLGRKMDP